MHALQNPYAAIGNPGEAYSLYPPASTDLRLWPRRQHSFGIQHIQLSTDHGEIKGHVRKARGRAVKVIPHAQIIASAKITSVVTIGKEALTEAESSRAGLILDAFKGGNILLTCPFVRKIFFPGYNLETLKWPDLPKTQPNISFTYRPLNESQQRAVKKCLSGEEEDRHVVVIVSPASLSSWFSSQWVPGATRDR